MKYENAESSRTKRFTKLKIPRAIVRTAKIKVGLRKSEVRTLRSTRTKRWLAEKRNYSKNDSRTNISVQICTVPIGSKPVAINEEKKLPILIKSNRIESVRPRIDSKNRFFDMRKSILCRIDFFGTSLFSTETLRDR